MRRAMEDGRRRRRAREGGTPGARSRTGCGSWTLLAAGTPGRPGRLTLLAASVVIAACESPQNVLDPRGPAAERIADLWWVMLWLATAVSVGVAAALLWAVHRSRRRQEGAETREVNGRALVWTGGVIVPVLILIPVLVYSFRVGAQVYPRVETDADALTIEVIGHQFWWEVRYPQHGVATANEIYIPAGERVRFQVSAPDVIHSFWVPQLQGKIDMIPGRFNTVWMQADEPGLFRGQCAEYCGMSHALMAFWVTAVPADEFAAWLEARAAAAPEPADPAVRRGREVFFAAGCTACHSTRGAPLPPGLGTVGPDLTGLASRRTLAAGVLPNTREALARWITDPRAIKPGVRMPPTPLADDEMQALLTYLRSLR